MSRRIGRRPNTSWSDEQLVAAARDANSSAVELLLARHYPYVLNVCRKTLGYGDGAEDAAQVALVSIAKNLGRFDGRSQFTTWCCRIATNAAIDEARRRGRHAGVEMNEAVEPIGADPAEAISQRVIIDSAVRSLRIEFREVLVLREFAGYDYEEIAARLDIPIGTVRSRLARARRDLAEFARSQGFSQSAGTLSAAATSKTHDPAADVGPHAIETP